MSGSSKQGVRPAQIYSHTLPSHHPGRHPPNSGSSHPDTRGRGRTATPRHPAPTQPLRRCAKPTQVVDSRLLLFVIPLASHHPARRRSRPASNTRRHAGGRLETACQEALLQDICTATRRWVNRCAGTLVTSAWITVMWLGTPELRPRPGSRAGQRSSLNHRQHRAKSLVASWLNFSSDLVRRGRVVPSVGGGMGRFSSGGAVDHGELSGGAARLRLTVAHRPRMQEFATSCMQTHTQQTANETFRCKKSLFLAS